MEKKDNDIERDLNQFTEMINASLASFNIMHKAGFDHYIFGLNDNDGVKLEMNIVALLQRITHVLIRERAGLEVENQKTK